MLGLRWVAVACLWPAAACCRVMVAGGVVVPLRLVCPLWGWGLVAAAAASWSPRSLLLRRLLYIWLGARWQVGVGRWLWRLLLGFVSGCQCLPVLFDGSWAVGACCGSCRAVCLRAERRCGGSRPSCRRKLVCVRSLRLCWCGGGCRGCEWCAHVASCCRGRRARVRSRCNCSCCSGSVSARCHVRGRGVFLCWLRRLGLQLGFRGGSFELLVVLCRPRSSRSSLCARLGQT